MKTIKGGRADKLGIKYQLNPDTSLLNDSEIQKNNLLKKIPQLRRKRCRKY